MIKFNVKKNMVRQAHHLRGFTLLEALVAISILMVAVAAPITIAQKGLSSAVYSKDQMVASYLAQDAIEYIKNQRDQITINDVNSDWASLWGPSYLRNCLISTNNVGCQIDTVKNTTPTQYSSSNFLYKDSNGFYDYDSLGTATKFTRQIQITPVKGGTDLDQNDRDEAIVKVTVAWASGSVVVNTLIYNY